MPLQNNTPKQIIIVVTSIAIMSTALSCLVGSSNGLTPAGHIGAIIGLIVFAAYNLYVVDCVQNGQCYIYAYVQATVLFVTSVVLMLMYVFEV
jgi:hypothetical protein